MYDILLKNARVLDPRSDFDGVKDIAIKDGKIAALETSLDAEAAEETYTLNGKIVTPGLVDAHCHPADGMGGNTVPPDVAGMDAGVLLMNDAGTTGSANFMVLRDFILPRSKTELVCFLNYASMGLVRTPELRSWQDADDEAFVKTVEENRKIIKGLKVRAMEAAAGLDGNVVKVVKKFSSELKLPVMIHLGEFRERRPDDPMDAFGREAVSALGKGDIVSHYMTARPGGMVLPDGRIYDELLEAKKRGVLLDSSHGKNNFSFKVARVLLEKGLAPDIISTDLCRTAYSTVQSLAVTMSKFLALGMDLKEVVAATTWRPAQALGMENEWGSLAVGRRANLSILELTAGNYWFFDGNAGNSLIADKLLEPRMVMKDGRLLPCRSHYHIDAEYAGRTGS